MELPLYSDIPDEVLFPIIDALENAEDEAKD